MRRKYGLGAIQKQQNTEAKFKEKSEAITKEQIDKLTDQMNAFKSHLEKFATKHKKAIKKNPEFRRQFQVMCATVGVDPLQSSNNFWTKLLGVGDFYYELAVQVIEVCMATSHQNGGLITIEDLLRRVRRSRSTARKKEEDITADDILRSINKLNVLGNGLTVLKSNKSYIIQSIPKELSMDHTDTLRLASSNSGFFNKTLIRSQLGWEDNRIDKVIYDMIMEGLIWIDNQEDTNSPSYWFPGLFGSSNQSTFP
ncbi:vacuolar-sorting protein SNF8-like [Panonychus citri]|uniref:vacuolar-sorting protein SNF8-like n=1 Tax=Panonychus citri TaxID=50023 RepID=UPI002307D000|nr:vacuolar-sorting protein SNF8-like [Panonychus citri]XP_053200320.1 vacuolar-sorting protein SNF8-like [Panonychus citri]XP_053200321.1 vacuolar-sorting protein SNF8-like [Panonychus citri]